MKYKVRDQFTIKQGRDFFHGGDVIELDDAEAENWAHAIEAAEKPAAKKVKADSDTSDAAK
jgi:hypothetical protein